MRVFLFVGWVREKREPNPRKKEKSRDKTEKKNKSQTKSGDKVEREWKCNKNFK